MMPTFDVEVRGQAREVYSVEAESAEQAAALWHLAGQPAVSEAYDMEVYSVTEERER
jgi:hypothetical protein